MQGKRFDPTDADREFVRRMVTAGRPQNKIAECLNISLNTLIKHFRYELITSRELLIGKAVRCLEESLDDGSLDAAKYTLARAANWSEKSEMDHKSSDGSMTPPTTIDASKLDDDTLRKLMDARRASNSDQ